MAERLRCASCGKVTRARNADILQGWYRGQDGARYCSSECTAKAPKPKGRGRPIFVRFSAPEGWTSKDVDRWKEYAVEQFAKLAIDLAMKEQAEAVQQGQGRVREFLPTDHGQVLALWKASEGIVLRDADERRTIVGYLRRNRGMSFVYEVGGAIGGAVLCGTDGRRGFLHHLAVKPELRRQGVGRMLVTRALGALADAGIHKCHLMVLPSNAAARRFWKRLGWVERTDVVLMSHSVTASA